MTIDHDMWNNGTFFANVYVAVTKDNLTFRGDGRDLTIIGSENFPEDQPTNFFGVAATAAHAGSVVVRDLSVENVRVGMYFATNVGEATGCRFVNTTRNGLRLFVPSSCLVEDCEFVDGGTGIKSYDPTRNLTIKSSNFWSTSAVALCVSTENVVIENCTAVNSRTGINVQQGSTGTIRDVDISVTEVSGITLEMGASVAVYDSRFEGGWCGIYSNGESIRCERVVLSGQTDWGIRINNTGNSVFRDCEFNPSGEYTVMCLYNGSGDCHIDMTNNYWGTDSEEQIAELIHDSNDDPGACCTVDFIPFHDQSTPTEQRSWSSVKDLFDSDGDR